MQSHSALLFNLPSNQDQNRSTLKSEIEIPTMTSLLETGLYKQTGYRTHSIEDRS